MRLSDDECPDCGSFCICERGARTRRTRSDRPQHGTRAWRKHHFLSNPDPMALLRLEIRASRAAVYHQHPCNPSRGAMSYTMTWEGHYVRVAWVDRKHPQLRAIGEVTVQPGGLRMFMKDIPLPVRHVLAGWIHMMYHRLADERVTERVDR